jgi:aminoglycoside phosphotransferase (APT) family kinase protein
MEALDIPDTLVHNDINFGNILFKGSRCVFTDWCEAGVGNPFLAFQYLCLLQSPRHEDWRPRLKDIYKSFWLDCLTTSQIEQAFVLVPPLAVLSYFYGRGTWLNSPLRNNPDIESHARSLARHMDHAIQDSLLLEAICH